MMKCFFIGWLMICSQLIFGQKNVSSQSHVLNKIPPNQASPLKIWYNKPAPGWEQSLPLGNGRLGAMPDGGIVNENIVLNEISLWSGGIQDADMLGAATYLPDIRRLLLEGKHLEAQQLMAQHFVCKGKGSGHGNGADVPYGSFQVLGNLHIKYDHKTTDTSIQESSYRRELDIDQAIATTQYTIGHTKYKREYFVGFADDIIAIRISSSSPGKINFNLELNRPERFVTKTVGQELLMSGAMNNGTDGNGMKYAARVRIVTEKGQLITTDTSLSVSDADNATIFISAATDFRGNDYLRSSAGLLKAACDKYYPSIKNDHIKNYRQLFHRAMLNIKGEPADHLPTDIRLENFNKGSKDNSLAALYFQFGRYLLISSTRPGLLPPNLQGLWANTIATPWNGDYHLDINIQMNHWPLNVTNLGMLNEPFFRLVSDLREPGSRTAKAYYNSDGWVAHVITNIWGYTSPGEHYSWGATYSGSAWLCQMLWSHYEFTLDPNYLEQLYPIIKGSALFYLQNLIREPSHNWLVTAPSNSPENAFYLPDGKTAHVCIGPTIDNQLIRKLFRSVITAAEITGKDTGFVRQLKEVLPQLPPDRIGSDGRLMEWLQEYKEPEPRHRHVSHLWALYPGDEILYNGTPDFAAAAKKTLEARGDQSTGWSIAWKMNFRARLHEGDKALNLLRALLKPVTGSAVNMTDGGGTYASLLCAHPPFQIDGNFGATAAIAEMLVQSHENFIELLPALPEEWKEGSFAGLCIRGGAEVSAKWKGNLLQEAEFICDENRYFRFKAPETAKKIIVAGHPLKLTAADKIIKLQLQKGKPVKIVVYY